jgi:Uma2 family endonuclease
MKRRDADHWTYADYLRLPEDGPRCEILGGARVMTPSPPTRHQAVSFRLGLALGQFVTSGELGTVLSAPCDVVLADDVVVQQDLLFVGRELTGIVKERGIFGAPDLVIEILSPSDPRRDTVRKHAIYGRDAVRECWIADPDRGPVRASGLRDRQPCGSAGSRTRTGTGSRCSP